MYTTDKTMGQSCEMKIYDLRDEYQISELSEMHDCQAVYSGKPIAENNEPMMVLPMPSSKVTSAVWAHLDQMIISGHENGDIIQWDMKEGEMVKKIENHSKQINDIQMSKDMTMFITASKDTTAKVSPSCHSFSWIHSLESFPHSSLIPKRWSTRRRIKPSVLSIPLPFLH
jgi:translation initiation factor 3 subunit I